MDEPAEERRNSSPKALPPGDFAIAELAADQDGLIASWQLQALGYGRDSIRHRREVGRLHAVYRGVYAVGHGQLSPRGHLRAALLAFGPDSLLSHRTAASIWGIRASAQTRVDVMDGAGDRFRKRWLRRGHVVQGAVRLHVRERHASGAREAQQRAHLIDDEIINLVRRHLHCAAAEAHEIWQARMSPDGDPMPLCFRHRPP